MIKNVSIALFSVCVLLACSGTQPTNSLSQTNDFLRQPMVGIVQDKAVPILIKTTGEGKVRIEYKKAGDPQIAFTEWQTVSHSNALTTNLLLSDLKDNSEYMYRVELDEKKYSKWFKFETFPTQGTPGKFSFIFGSGMREKYATPPVYINMQNAAPTFIALMGDQMYGDYDGNLNKLEEYLSNDSLRLKQIEEGEVMLKETSVLDAFRGKYHRAFMETFQNMSSSIPIMGTWDDHDMGQDNNDSTYPYKLEAKQAFLESYPTYPYEVSEEGLYYRFAIADVDAFVPDTRWYRSPMQNAEGPEKYMLGETQLKWLLDGLENSSAKFKIIFSSVPFNDYGGDTSSGRPGSFDSWMGYTYARNQLLSAIRERKIEGVVVFGADQHYPSAHIVNWKAPITSISKTDTSVAYSLTELDHAIFDFSAGPFNYKRATGIPLLPENQENTSISYEVYRPEWAKPENAHIYKPFNTGVSVYGLAEFDTESSPATISVKFYEMDPKTKKMVELYKILLSD